MTYPRDFGKKAKQISSYKKKGAFQCYIAVFYLFGSYYSLSAKLLAPNFGTSTFIIY